MIKLCAPAVIYVIFSITQILIDSFNGLFNTALMKMVVMIMVTFLLQILCENGLNIISWIIVFIPFILMSVIVSLLLYFFGLNTSTGKINYSCKPVGENEENQKEKRIRDLQILKGGVWMNLK
jgi:predicted membrane protein